MGKMCPTWLRCWFICGIRTICRWTHCITSIVQPEELMKWCSHVFDASQKLKRELFFCPAQCSDLSLIQRIHKSLGRCLWCGQGISSWEDLHPSGTYIKESLPRAFPKNNCLSHHPWLHLSCKDPFILKPLLLPRLPVQLQRRIINIAFSSTHPLITFPKVRFFISPSNNIPSKHFLI